VLRLQAAPLQAAPLQAAPPPAAAPVAAPPPAVQAPPRAPPPQLPPAVPPVRELEEAPPPLPPPDDDETTMTSRRSDSESGAEQAVPPDQAAQEAPVWFPPAPSPPPLPPAAPLPPAEPPVAQPQIVAQSPAAPPPAPVVTQPPAPAKSHVASAASPWATVCTDLLAAIENQKGIMGFRNRLVKAGFRCGQPIVKCSKGGYYEISVPLTFPCCYDVSGKDYASNQDMLRSKPQLVKYFEGCIALAQAGGAYRTEADREKDEGEDARRAALESDDDDAPHAPPQPIVRVPPPPRKATGQVEEFKVGDRVKALYQRGQRWYPGRVVAVNVQHRSLGVCDRSYDIEYDDGDEESNVRPALMRRIRAPAAARPPALPKPPRRAAGGAAARPFQPEEDSEGTPAAPALAQTPATPRPAAPKKRAPRSLDLGPCRPGAQGAKSIFKPPTEPRRAKKRARTEEPEFLFREGDSVWARERPDIKEASHGTVVEDIRVGASTGKVKWDNPAYPEATLPIAQIAPARSGRRSSR
jgi:hypothetical protein